MVMADISTPVVFPVVDVGYGLCKPQVSCEEG